jgi:hypothetical protein
VRHVFFLLLLASSGQACGEISAQSQSPASLDQRSGGHFIHAQPNPAPLANTLGSTTITWRTANGEDASVYVSKDGDGEVLFARGAAGRRAADWISADAVYQFRLYSTASSRTLLGSVEVRAAPSSAVTKEPIKPRLAFVAAEPNPVPSGDGLGKTTISWDTGDGSAGRVAVSVNGGPEALFATGPAGSKIAEWIDGGGATYRVSLYRQGVPHHALATVTITRRDWSQAAALAVASTVGLIPLLVFCAWVIDSWLDRETSRDAMSAPWAALIALSIHMVSFRAALAYELAAGWNLDTLGLVGWNEHLYVVRVLSYAARDLVIALAVFVTAWTVSRLQFLRGTVIRYVGHGVLIAVLSLVGVTGAAHLRMVMELRAGLDWPALHEGVTVLAGDVDDFIRWTDWALAVSPALLYLFLRSRWGLSDRWCSAFLLGGLLSLAGVGILRQSTDSTLLVDHPTVAITQQLAFRPDLGTATLEPLAVDAKLRPGLIDPAIASPPLHQPVRAEWCDVPQHPTSLLLIIVEAVAMRQIVGPDGEINGTMPNLSRLAKGGWWFQAHRASANSSAQAAFSIFTGLHSFPETGLSVTSSRFWMPAIWSRLPLANRFLVSPAILDGYFPLGLVRRDGLEDIRGYYELRPSAYRPRPAGSLNEIDGIDALIRRLQSTAGRPFFGTYWANGPHSPYFDADPTRRMIQEPADERDRYLNALRTFDTQVGRVLDALREVNHLDDTLVVIVADHGQAFGEHGSWQHGRSSWEEVLHVPALIWQPTMIPPRGESRLTTHADLLPTVLDLLGIAFDPLEFQGESLCVAALRRRYVFANGREGVVVSWDVAARTKLVWSHLDGGCQRFELASDSDERTPLPCQTESMQLEATKRFYLSQRKVLLDYRNSRISDD